MVEVIPSINVATFEEVYERIKKVEPHVKWCHLDVTDGIFTKHTTWHNAKDLVGLNTALSVEAHLMVVNPEKIIDQWFIKPIKRVIVHLEAVSDMDYIIQKGQEAGIEIGIAINPDTFWGKLKPWFDKVSFFQVLAVSPGPSGQKIHEDIFDKIIHMRKFCPQCIMEIDGGINPETAKKAKYAGINMVVAGAFIFSNQDIYKAIESLKSV